jgi:anti-anti-sigma regulatory factor
MSTADLTHFRLRNVHDVVVVDVVSKDIQGPDMTTEFICELMKVVEQDDAKPILLNLRPTTHLSSMGYAALFKLVKGAKERQRPVRFCNMHPDVRVGAEIVGVPLVVEIDDCEESALKALAPAGGREQLLLSLQ